MKPFEKQLIEIINENKVDSSEPLNEYEVDELVDHLKNRINLMEGNIDEDGFLEIESVSATEVTMLKEYERAYGLLMSYWDEFNPVMQDKINKELNGVFVFNKNEHIDYTKAIIKD